MTDSKEVISSMFPKHYYRLPDVRCNTIRKEVENMTEREANDFFCQRKSQAARDILDKETQHNEPDGKYRDRCKEYIKHKGGLIYTPDKPMAGWIGS
jgi:hypothetical protein